MRRLGLWIQQQPRLAAAVLFGGATATVTFFAWFPSARLNGAVPVLCLGAGLAHAFAGALTGPRIVDVTRTRTGWQAGWLGAVTSLVAILLFAPPFAWWIAAGNASSTGAFTYVVLTVLVGFFSFLAAGWALFAVSIGVGWALHWASLRAGRPAGPTSYT